nr:T9SS type A sorting domain-containing protein [Bacteroidales bacterium]
DHVMAITEPLPQWEQDSLEVLITDVIYDPDDPDNPGGDEGIGEVDGGLQSAVSLRPNPTSGVTTVSCAEAISELTVCDMAGRVVLRKAACGATATFDTSTLRKGVYLVKVSTARGTVTKKLVVE